MRSPIPQLLTFPYSSRAPAELESENVKDLLKQSCTRAIKLMVKEPVLFCFGFWVRTSSTLGPHFCVAHTFVTFCRLPSPGESPSFSVSIPPLVLLLAILKLIPDEQCLSFPLPSRVTTAGPRVTVVFRISLSCKLLSKLHKEQSLLVVVLLNNSIGCILGFITDFWATAKYNRETEKNGGVPIPEYRLWLVEPFKYPTWRRN